MTTECQNDLLRVIIDNIELCIYDYLFKPAISSRFPNFAAYDPTMTRTNTLPK